MINIVSYDSIYGVCDVLVIVLSIIAGNYYSWVYLDTEDSELREYPITLLKSWEVFRNINSIDSLDIKRCWDNSSFQLSTSCLILSACFTTIVSLVVEGLICITNIIKILLDLRKIDTHHKIIFLLRVILYSARCVFIYMSVGLLTFPVMWGCPLHIESGYYIQIVLIILSSAVLILLIVQNACEFTIVKPRGPHISSPDLYVMYNPAQLGLPGWHNVITFSTTETIRIRNI